MDGEREKRTEKKDRKKETRIVAYERESSVKIPDSDSVVKRHTDNSCGIYMDAVDIISVSSQRLNTRGPIKKKRMNYQISHGT